MDQPSEAFSSLSSTTEELFRIWQGNCLDLLSSKTRSKVRPRVTAIKDESRQFFASLVHGTTLEVSDTIQLQTKPSHADALAVLIRSLEPCFRADHQDQDEAASNSSIIPRWAALSCLVGAVQGCSRQAELPVPLVKLLSTFLLQHAGPIETGGSGNNEEDEEDAIIEDYDEQIRDTAVTGLTALLQCRDAKKTQVIVSEETLQLWLAIAKDGVERRCTDTTTNTDRDDAMNNSSVDEQQYTNYHYGLSMLPRSRRSLCFDLIRAAVDAFQTGLPRDFELTAKSLSEMTDFAKFTISCLHGESDPRCLRQLLELFVAVLEAFRPLGTRFPISELFDAVAPYYPIQFNPPPNDTHGITKDDLRRALLRILSCTRYDDPAQPNDVMATLSCGIILESLVPPPEDGPATESEQMEALEDLQTFLFAKHDDDDRTNCDVLDATELTKISNALLVVHETTSLAVSRGVVQRGRRTTCRTGCATRVVADRFWRCRACRWAVD